MTTSDTTPRCLYCEQSSDDAPLVALHYRGSHLWICTQHLPVLIHNPRQLAHKLPGAEHLAKAEHHDHEE